MSPRIIRSRKASVLLVFPPDVMLIMRSPLY
jgi:hypothetical protein